MKWKGRAHVIVEVEWEIESDPDYFEGLVGRTPEHLVRYAALVGGFDPERTDGWADFKGHVNVSDTFEPDWTENEETT